MAFQLTREETAVDGIRRIAIELLDKALAAIDNRDDAIDVTIHEVRKRCKEMRGLLRLVRPGLGPVYRDENTWYRDSARLLSEYRDAKVQIETFDTLLESFGEAVSSKSYTSLRQALVDHYHARVDRSEEIEQRLNVFRDNIMCGRDRVGDWRLEADGFALFENGLEKTYRRGGRAMRLAYKTMTDEAFHQWRKRTKYHWYHARLLEGAWPELLADYCGELDRLSSCLGTLHDLAELKKKLLADCSQSETGDSLFTYIGLIRQRQAELQPAARLLGERIFSEKPGQLGRRFRAYWHAWQHD